MPPPLEALRNALLHEVAVHGPLVPVYGDGPPKKSVPKTFSERIQELIPKDSPLRGMSSLEEIKAFVEATQLLPIDAGRHKAVFGSGDPDADLVIIGEAPGADEDQAGLPFVGRAGQLLTRILGSVDITRDEVYITNILKTRPPENRNPQPDEMAVHIPILYRQLALINPKILLCLGKIAGNALLRKTQSLAKMRTCEHDFHGIPELETPHMGRHESSALEVP